MKRRSSRPKPSKLLDTISVRYSREHWDLLGRMRAEAAKILLSLREWKDSALAHGSLARGDVDEKSDIDILIPVQASTGLIISSLETSGFSVLDRKIAQATPGHTPKAHIYLDENNSKSVTVPLAPFRRLEQEFYKFGGTLTLRELQENMRKAGCTKKLTLIDPTSEGHTESPIIGREYEVARALGVSVDLVKERVRVLTRRDTVGRTGVFLKLNVPEDVSFEEALRAEATSNPALRRTLQARGTGR